MTHDTRRITLITRDPQRPDHDWNDSRQAPNRLILLDSFMVLKYAISSNMVDLDVDVERVILDRATSPSEYLTLLSSLPSSFNGDVLLIREGESSFLSSMGRGGDRVLYALSVNDLRFYLETHGLVTGRVATSMGRSMPRLRAVV
ncbi:MAG: hypothetical protein ACXW2P_08540 [Thermoanaerobaculia bacterium]